MILESNLFKANWLFENLKHLKFSFFLLLKIWLLFLFQWTVYRSSYYSQKGNIHMILTSAMKKKQLAIQKGKKLSKKLRLKVEDLNFLFLFQSSPCKKAAFY